MNRLDNYLSQYAESHQHQTNVRIHLVCVPAIMFSLLGILKAFPVPASWPLWLDWSSLLIIAALVFYASLKSLRVFSAMVLFVIPQVLLLEWLRPRFFLLSLLIFIVAWIFQFVGHKIEGKKPAFFKDLFFLLIGPIWVVSHLCHQMGISFPNNAKDT